MQIRKRCMLPSSTSCLCLIKTVTAVIVKQENYHFLSGQMLNCTTSVNKCKFNFLVTLVYRTARYSTMQRQVFTRQEATSTT